MVCQKHFLTFCKSDIIKYMLIRNYFMYVPRGGFQETLNMSSWSDPTRGRGTTDTPRGNIACCTGYNSDKSLVLS